MKTTLVAAGIISFLLFSCQKNDAPPAASPPADLRTSVSVVFSDTTYQLDTATIVSMKNSGGGYYGYLFHAAQRQGSFSVQFRLETSQLIGHATHADQFSMTFPPPPAILWTVSQTDVFFPYAAFSSITTDNLAAGSVTGYVSAANRSQTAFTIHFRNVHTQYY